VKVHLPKLSLGIGLVAAVNHEVIDDEPCRVRMRKPNFVVFNDGSIISRKCLYNIPFLTLQGRINGSVEPSNRSGAGPAPRLASYPEAR